MINYILKVSSKKLSKIVIIGFGQADLRRRHVAYFSCLSLSLSLSLSYSAFAMFIL